MAGIDKPKIDGSVWKLTLKQFLDLTAKNKPEITGGCMVATVAAMASTLLMMSLEISAKKLKGIPDYNLLKEKLKVLRKIRKRISEAADEDLKIFDKYRYLKTNADSKLKKKLLLYSIDSPLKLAKLISECLFTAQNCSDLVDPVVLSDIKASGLLLGSAFNSILILAESNIMLLKSNKEYPKYECIFNVIKQHGLKQINEFNNFEDSAQ